MSEIPTPRTDAHFGKALIAAPRHARAFAARLERELAALQIKWESIQAAERIYKRVEALIEERVSPWREIAQRLHDRLAEHDGCSRYGVKDAVVDRDFHAIESTKL